MRKLGWFLIIVGPIFGLLYAVGADHETAARIRAWSEANSRSWDGARIRASIQMLNQGLVPAWTVVSPWPGVVAGLAACAFGIILLALRPPIRHPSGEECQACSAPAGPGRVLCARCSS
jgi:hypothetical protein